MPTSRCRNVRVTHRLVANAALFNHSSYILLRNNNSSFEQFQKKILLIGNDWEIGERRYPETVGLSDHMPLQLIFSIK